jgi:hypothetical protein
VSYSLSPAFLVCKREEALETVPQLSAKGQRKASERRKERKFLVRQCA